MRAVFCSPREAMSLKVVKENERVACHAFRVYFSPYLGGNTKPPSLAHWQQSKPTQWPPEGRMHLCLSCVLRQDFLDDWRLWCWGRKGRSSLEVRGQPTPCPVGTHSKR